MDMDMYVTEVTDFKSEVGFDLKGCLVAVVASEGAKILSHFYCPCRHRYIGPLPSCLTRKPIPLFLDIINR